MTATERAAAVAALAAHLHMALGVCGDRARPIAAAGLDCALTAAASVAASDDVAFTAALDAYLGHGRIEDGQAAVVALREAIDTYAAARRPV